MSDFGEELSSLMAKKTISVESLCQMAELNPAYLEKLKCGKLLPSNYGVVKKFLRCWGLCRRRNTSCGIPIRCRSWEKSTCAQRKHSKHCLRCRRHVRSGCWER